MPTPKNSPEKNISLLANRNEALRQSLRQRDPKSLAANTGAIYLNLSPESGEFALPFWQAELVVSFPEFIMRYVDREQGLGVAQQALILYYFHTANGAPLTNQWISFADLPDGRFYNQAFQGYTGQELARFFRNDRHHFIQACEQAHGIPFSIGDAAYSFLLFPRVPILALMWQGDEDFPSNYQVLFDASASHYLPTDACAIAGSMLTRLIIKSAV